MFVCLFVCMYMYIYIYKINNCALACAVFEESPEQDSAAVGALRVLLWAEDPAWPALLRLLPPTSYPPASCPVAKILSVTTA